MSGANSQQQGGSNSGANAESGNNASSSATENHPEESTERRINIGWVTGRDEKIEDLDKKIASYCHTIGLQNYNFISFPVGGIKRSYWDGQSELPPPIDLPDLQLKNHLWETYVNGSISEWIDCDSSDARIAELSEKELVKELNYAVYMGLRSIVIHLRHADSPRLAKVVNQYLWTKNVNMAMWVIVPSTMSRLEKKPDDKRDCWEVWADFRTLCSNFNCAKLIAGLNVLPDLDEEFVDSKLIKRWWAEPIGTFLIDSSVFQTDSSTCKAVLPPCHRQLLQSLWISDLSRLLVRTSVGATSRPELRQEYSEELRTVIRGVNKRKGLECEGFLADGNINYMDVLQAPLQPLADNLDSSVYNTFEQDPIKYRRYKEAVEACLTDLGNTPAHIESLVLYVLGAGRGPLVTMSLEAERDYNEQHRTKKDRLKLKIVVVEKNSNAIVTLRYMNEKAWKQRCTIVESDMRALPEIVKSLGLPQPDIIVSELLGSFGDNELSPECLDGVTSLLKPTTISIPSSYTSYISPIMSILMHQTILSAQAGYWNSGIPGHGRQGTVQLEDGTYRQHYPKGLQVANLDQVYVVFLRQCCHISEAEKVFTFDHPNFTQSSNERHAEIDFTLDVPADIMGFAGYFHMTLYKNITLSIEPKTYSKGMISWFPALLPLRKLHRVHAGDKIKFVITRKVDSEGVWYEWFINYTDKDGVTQSTALQNENGESYYMKLYG
ncbi:unnamed protein product [Auanema sp. JU1783]|nr:unnamed protein product [Auanema sp. JU1783]